MTAWLRPFDANVSSSTGDLWQAAVNPSVLSTFSPVVASPGQTVTIDVTFTPSGPRGSRVSGDLFVDSAAEGLPTAVYGQLTGDELAAIPYSYVISR